MPLAGIRVGDRLDHLMHDPWRLIGPCAAEELRGLGPRGAVVKSIPSIRLGHR